MFSDEVISRLKLKVPAIDKIVHPDYYSYGIVQMDIKKEDGSLRQLSEQLWVKLWMRINWNYKSF